MASEALGETYNTNANIATEASGENKQNKHHMPFSHVGIRQKETRHAI